MNFTWNLMHIWYEGWWLLPVNKYMTFVVLSVLDLFLFWLLFYIALLLYLLLLYWIMLNWLLLSWCCSVLLIVVLLVLLCCSIQSIGCCSISCCSIGNCSIALMIVSLLQPLSLPQPSHREKLAHFLEQRSKEGLMDSETVAQHQRMNRNMMSQKMMEMTRLQNSLTDQAKVCTAVLNTHTTSLPLKIFTQASVLIL